MKNQRKTQMKQGIGLALAVMIIATGCSPAMRKLNNVPDQIRLTKGHSTQLSLPKSVSVALSSEGACAISGMDQQLKDLDPSYILTGEAEGDASIVLSVLGLPVKTVPVSVSEGRTVMPGGQSIGVAITVGGALVVGVSDIGGLRSPARQAGLRPGDRIVKVDGIEIGGAASLAAALTGQQQVFTVDRDESELLVPITAIKDSRDGLYRLGAWVRDSTAGVGTLSFYDPESGNYAALGHPITDADTGTLLPVGEGYIYESHIVGLMRGQSGEPGELLGEFFDEDKQLGEVESNSELGLYGQSDEPMLNELYPRGISVMARSEVKTGPAKIITTIEGRGMKEYDCEIVRLYHQDEPSSRSMVVKITDPELLESTGGIVQGMSGSPIVQDGRLAGAVTHVFINDPTQGYGLYAEWMIDKCVKAPA